MFNTETSPVIVDNIMLVIVKTLSGKEIKINILPKDTIMKMKTVIEENEGIPPPQQRLIYMMNTLKDNDIAIKCDLKEGSIIHF